MRSAWIMALSGLVSAATLVAAALPQEEAPAEPIYTSREVFLIPFRIQPPGPGQEPVEVQLHHSENYGTSWRLYEKAAPSAENFKFRASHDGEYWFFVRTRDRQGRLRPAGPPRAELRVVVDTELPQLDVQAVRGPSGEIEAHWQARDSHLDPTSVTLEYRTGTLQPWQPVAVEDAQPEGDGTTFVGGATFWAEGASEELSVRVEVLDRAGNREICQVPVAAVGDPTLPGQFVSSEPRSSSRRGQSGSSAEEVIPPGTAEALPYPRTNAGEPIGPGVLPDSRAARAASTGEGIAPGYPATGEAEELPDGPGFGTQFEPDPQAGLVRNDYASPDGVEAEIPGLLSGVLPNGVHPRMVNSRRFELQYEFDSLGSAGVRRVELWGTADGGKTWSNFGADADQRSPIVAQAPGPGVYGFRLVVESSNDLRSPEPLPGDLPDVWIGVDLTRPRAAFIAADQGTGEHAGELAIRWEADDALLAARPVTLYFSQTPGGPWTIVAAGLENSGHFFWRLDAHTPPRVYLRLEVRDEAGNSVLVDAPQPVSLQPSQPRGLIRDVRPVEEAQRGGSRRIYNLR